MKKFLQKHKGSIRAMGTYQFLIKRFVLLFYLVSLVYRAACYDLSFQMKDPAYRISGGDVLMTLYNRSGLNYFVFENLKSALVFNILLFIFWLLAFIFVRKKIFGILFYLFFLLYVLGFNANIGFPSSYLKGLVIIGAIFFVNTARNFELMWDGLRYYACWLYFSAFILKIILGAFFMPRFGEMTFRDNMTWYIYLNHGSFLSNFYTYFLHHPWLLNVGDKLVFLFEGLYFVGFFTKKYDKYLGWGIVCLHLFLYYFSDTLFAEIFVLAVPFISTNWWSRIAQLLKINSGPTAFQWQKEI